MKIFQIYLLTTCIFFSTDLLAQNGPPPEVDMLIRATVDLLMNPEAKDYKKFITNYYSQNQITNAGLDSLEVHLKEIKKSTLGAGGIDVANQNGVFRISFSGGVNAIVDLILESGDLGKIRSLNLAQTKNPSEMTAEENYDNALDSRLRKMESLARFTTDSEFEDFIKENFSTSFISKNPIPELVLSLRKLKLSVASASIIGALPSEVGSGAVLQFRGGKSADVSISIEETPPYLVNQFSIDYNVSIQENEGELLPITWENYNKQLKQEEGKGFSGVILIARNGKIVHQEGYGFANKEAKIKNNIKTLFDIGSIPIDFTRAAILKLVDQKKISYADPITKFIENVPNDKKLITIENLMTNQSGLFNFHGDEAKDRDHDLSWISREEAINRMLSHSLLFEPGSDVSLSHSGYGLLAAIVEIVSGKTYEAFLTETFFTPLKMKNTGPYGMESGLNPENMAVGYGMQASKPNIPAKWGPTSWLIKGSGGMVSNPSDLYLWNKGLHNGNILSQKSKEIYSQGRVALGGSERGFFASYLRSPDNIVIICSNSDRSSYPDVMKLFQSLASLYK